MKVHPHVHAQAATVSPVPAALAEIRRGQPIVVLDDADRKNEGQLIFAAQYATPSLLSFVVSHGTGFVCTALQSADCDRLGIPAMPVENRAMFGTAYRVTVDAVDTGTGISAAARARTIATLASADSVPRDFTRPGHVIPLQARRNGVLQRRGHTEAAVDLARMAGLRPVGGLSGIVSTQDTREMADGEEARRFAAEHGLASLTIDDIVHYRLAGENIVERLPGVTLRSPYAFFHTTGYCDTVGQNEHVALLAPETDLACETPVYVYRHGLTRDLFGTLGCTCNSDLVEVLDGFEDTRRGVIICLNSPQGCAHSAAHIPYVAAAIVEDMGVRQPRLLHADAVLHTALNARGIRTVGRITSRTEQSRHTVL